MLKVMIVEDEPSAMERYAQYIENYSGCFIIASKASTYREAREQFQLCQPDLVFTDIRIPGNTGLTLLEEFRSSGWGGLAVIISGYDDFDYARKAIRLSVFDYLLKPVFQEDMSAILRGITESLHRKPDNLAEEENWQTYPEYIKRTLQYVILHYHKNLTLSDVAQYAHVSSAHLSASFHRIYGMTFIEYLRNYRVSRARELLEETSLSLDEIAEQTGLTDSSYLNRCFRKVTGQSPGRYRQKMRRNPPEQCIGEAHGRTPLP